MCVEVVVVEGGAGFARAFALVHLIVVASPKPSCSFCLQLRKPLQNLHNLSKSHSHSINQTQIFNNMPPNRTSKPSTKPFKPPRLSNASTGNKPAKTPSKPQPKPSTSRSKASTQSSSSAASRSQRHEEVEVPDNDDADLEEVADPFGDAPAANIPPELLTRLLREFMDDGEGPPMKISRGADRAVGKYMETFVREAIARAAFERAEAAAKDGGRGAGDGFLEVRSLSLG